MPPKKATNCSCGTPKADLFGSDDAQMDAIIKRLENLLDSRFSQLETSLARRLETVEAMFPVKKMFSGRIQAEFGNSV